MSTKVREGANPSPFDWWAIGSFDVGPVELGEFPSVSFTTTTCTPTFDHPCAIDFAVANGPVIFHQQIQGLFD